MGKLRSNRVKRTPQAGITSDRYQFLGLEQAEPNLGDPTVGPSSIGVNPIKAGTLYNFGAIGQYPGERYWYSAPVGIGTSLGVISVYANNVLPSSAFQRINGLNFVGSGVTVETPPLELIAGSGIGIATIRFTVSEVSNKGQTGQVLYNSPSGFVYGADGLYYVSGNVGIGSTLPRQSLDVLGNGYFSGIVTAYNFVGNLTGTAATAYNVIGGIASVTSLSASGVSTLGVTSVTNLTSNTLVVSGVSTLGVTSVTNLTSNTLTVSGVSTLGITSATNLTSNTLVVSGVSTLGIITASNGFFSGIITATKFVGSLEGNINVNAATATTAYNVIGGIASVTSLTVSGVSTLGVTSVTDLKTNTLIVSGVSTLGVTSATNLTSNTLVVSGVSTLGLTSVTNLNTNTLVVSGVSTLGIITASNGFFSGVITATKFVGGFDGNINGNAATATTAYNVIGGIASVTSLSVSGVSTLGTVQVSLGIITATSGIVTYYGDGRYLDNVIVGLGTQTFGDYVKNITGTVGEIEVSITSGEGVSPQIGLPDDVIIGRDLTVRRDVQIDRNLNVTGNITVGGTSAYLIVNNLQVKDRDIVLGVVTDVYGNDVSTDTTANHGGIAIASTEGTPLVSLAKIGINSLPDTYKQIMWVGQNTMGAGTTDAWLINYGVGIGSTQVPNGVTLAIGKVNITNDSIISINNINASGIITANKFVGNIEGNINANAATATTAYNVIGGIASVTSLVVSGVSTLGVTSATNLTSNTLVVSGVSTLGVTSATNLTSNTLVVSGVSTLGITSVTNLKSNTLTVSGVSTLGTVQVSSGIITATSGIVTYYGDGSKLTGVTATSLSGIATYATYAGIATVAQGLTGNPSISITNLNVSGISTLGTVQVSSGIITATSGIVTYYGDGSKLTGVTATSLSGVSTVAQRLETARTLNISGNQFVATGATFDGTQNASIALALATQAGVTSGVYGGTTAIPVLGVNSSGIVTSISTVTITNISGNAGSATTSTNVIGGIASVTSLNVSGVSTLGTIQVSSGIITATSGVVTYYGDGSKLTNVTATSLSGIATVAQGLTGNPSISITNLTASGISTLGTIQVSSGIITATSGVVTYYGDGSKLTNVTATLLSGIATYATYAGYASTAGIATVAQGLTGSPNISVTSLNVSGISTLGTVQISSGIVTSTSGIVTYYGDGSKLSGINVSGSVSISTNTTNQSQYLTYVTGTGPTTGFGITNTGLVFNPSTTRLGIGTTSPSSNLHVQGNTLVTGVSTLGTVQVSSGIVTSTTGIVTYYGDGSKLTGVLAAASPGGSSGQVQFNNAGAIGGASYFNYDSTNIRVGIGTSVPTARLSVSNPTSGNSLLLVNDNLSDGSLFRVSNSAGNLLVDVDANGTVLFPTSGNIGIGTTLSTPTTKLHVDGDVRITGRLYDSNNATGTSGQVLQSVGTGISWVTFSGGGGGTVSISTNITNQVQYLTYVTTTGTATTFGVNTSGLVFNPSTNSLGIGTTNPTYNLQVNGSFGATTKSFIINHPTKEGKKLQYGSLESPYHGIRLTGSSTIKTGKCIVELPDYIHTFVKEEGITIHITNIKHGKVLWVDEVNLTNNNFVVKTEEIYGEYDFYWDFTAIRNDVEDMVVEF
jgi:hypothetical protein